MSTTSALQESQTLDGYTLIRQIGQGGFGQVWLVRNEATSEYRALKWIASSSVAHLDQELEALTLYRQGLHRVPSHNLLSIEHVRLIGGGLFYTMPLADGPEGISPVEPDWYPITLATLIAGHRAYGSWLTSSEIRFILSCVLEAAQCLSQAGVVHRDIKPENVLFLRGQPCLGDCGLSTSDVSQITRKGTPVYLAPSWYVESSGNPDMWGCACLLYVLLTGNSPDKMGRASFIWPPAGENSLSDEEKTEWRRLHNIVHRATADSHNDRYLDFDRFKAAITGPGNLSPQEGENSPRKKKRFIAVTCSLLAIPLLSAIGFYATHRFGAVEDAIRPTISTNSDIKQKPFEPLHEMTLFEANAEKAEQRIINLEKETTPTETPPDNHPAKLSEFLIENRYTTLSDFEKIFETLNEIRVGLTQFDPDREKPQSLILPTSFQEVDAQLEALKTMDLSLTERSILNNLSQRLNSAATNWAANYERLNLSWVVRYEGVFSRYWALVQNLHQEAEADLAALISTKGSEIDITTKKAQLQKIEDLKPFPNLVFEKRPDKRPDKLPDRGYERGYWEDRF